MTCSRNILLGVVLAVNMEACNNAMPSDLTNAAAGIASQKTEAAISCVGNSGARSAKGAGEGRVNAGAGPISANGAAFGPTRLNTFRPEHIPAGMVWIPGGEFSMGNADPVGTPDGGHERMNDARPVHRVYIDGFLMDATEVTNNEFAAFVKATGYVTVAEQKPTRTEFPDAKEENLVTGSIVFTPPPGAVPLDNLLRWWSYVERADWRHPTGPESSITGKGNYPVVQIAWVDAEAYAKWAGKRLPTEAEWEFAARGGKAGELYTWGDELTPGGRWMANTFQGRFPGLDDAEDGFAGIAPVAQYPPNAFGLYDMAGNVWEWCSDWYRSDYYSQLSTKGVSVDPAGPETPYDAAAPGEMKKVQRGGSFLCTDQYCTRYMVGTRGKGEWRSAANHIGFRCVRHP
ncbi:MAG TPA: formylglycine-generating enzyme family protein [Puia sp.]|nr:formylglycine-generating enzyme family protein [Puia sp.]